jgi:glycogen debranching enzyme
VLADQGWTYAGEPVSLEQPGGLVTIVEGSSFSLCGRAGDIRPGAAEGLFVLDTRVVSQWELLVDGCPLEPLSVSVTVPFAATFVSRLPPIAEQAESTLLAVRQRWVGSGMREDLELRNYSNEPQEHLVELRVASDLADLFAVKAGRVETPPADTHADGILQASAVKAGTQHAVRIVERSAQAAAEVAEQGLSWRIVVPAKGVWSSCLEVTLSVGGREVPLQYRCGDTPAESRPSVRLAGWRRRLPAVTSSDQRLRLAIGRAVDDIGSLVIEDPAHPETPVVAAGAPWFMTLFGRDSLLTSYMSLIVDPALAIGVLQTLARLQGTRVNPATEEQPGRILHEVRFGSTTATDLDDGHIYYGTADATPLFVVLIGELARWGVEQSVVDGLLPHADRALQWVEEFGDRDGDGYVEYERLTPDGLANQGWKDSWDGVSYADGRLATTPIALAEVQAYVYAAYVARAELAAARGDATTATRCSAKAVALRDAFNRDFWLPDRGWFAVALDGEKRPVDSLASNVGHCLWSGIVDEERAAAVASQLLSRSMFSGWGLRTLATEMPRYNPLSYHNGSVWPHDSALAAWGLMRYGFEDQACRIVDAVLDAAAANSGRLPELYAGLDREELPVPVAYPTSCSPQAWAAATPLLMLRMLLRFEPRLDLGSFTVAPVPGVHRVTGAEFDFAGSRLRIAVAADGTSDVSGLPAGVAREPAPRSRLADRAAPLR